MTLLYRAGWQLTKVKAFMLACWIAVIPCTWWGWYEFQTLGLRPADGGVLAPFSSRLLLGGGITLGGLLVAFGMWIYGKRYAASIHYDRLFDRIHIRTVDWIFTGRDHVFPPSAVDSSFWHVGGMYWHHQYTEAPWLSLRVHGFPTFLIDGQGTFEDLELAVQLLKRY